MKREEFFQEIYFYSQTEVSKVKYLSYFNFIKDSVKDFSLADIVQWLDELNLPRPNKSRLREKLNKSSDFIKYRNKKERYCLHANAIENLKQEIPNLKPDFKPKIKSNKSEYISSERIKQILSINNKNFDIKKLVQMCDELNIAHSFDNFLSMIMLTRAIIDHVPPIFNCKNFAELSNNYKGTKSFRESIAHLDNSSRKIADSHLHSHIRKKEVLPNITQVDFSNDIDVLLSEIYRLLQ